MRQAADLLHDAARHFPHQPDMAFNHAFVRYELGEYEVAVRALEKLIRPKTVQPASSPPDGLLSLLSPRPASKPPALPHPDFTPHFSLPLFPPPPCAAAGGAGTGVERRWVHEHTHTHTHASTRAHTHTHARTHVSE